MGNEVIRVYRAPDDTPTDRVKVYDSSIQGGNAAANGEFTENVDTSSWSGGTYYITVTAQGSDRAPSDYAIPVGGGFLTVNAPAVFGFTGRGSNFIAASATCDVTGVTADAGSVLLIGTGNYEGYTVSGLTVGGLTGATKVVGDENTGLSVELWEYVVPAGGISNATVSVTISGVPTSFGVSVTEATGINSTISNTTGGPSSPWAGYDAATSYIELAITTTGSKVFAVFVEREDVSYSAGANTTLIHDVDFGAWHLVTAYNNQSETSGNTYRVTVVPATGGWQSKMVAAEIMD